MPATCPNGHVSEAEDYCDTCGSPISTSTGSAGATPPPLPDQAAAPSAPSAPPPAAPSAKPCPNCATENDDDALFCENCGYDFTTGALPRPPEPVSELDLGAGSAATGPVPRPDADPAAAPVAPPIPGPPSGSDTSWVAEIWVDPDWYAQQDAEEPCPSPGLPVTIPLLAQSLLIGRKSVSRNIHPQLDITSDIGISRRHAQLTTDGQRWWVEDLQSSNGTFVGDTRGPLPTQPVPPGQRRELGEDDRLYLGAWTRIVIRRTLPGEVF